MKKIFLVGLVFLGITSSASAEIIEGRLLQKYRGEIDPFILGDGCVSLIEYFDHDSNEKLIIIYESRLNKCVSSGVQVNEEIDFDTHQLQQVVAKNELSALRDFARHVMKIELSKISGFYKIPLKLRSF